MPLPAIAVRAVRVALIALLAAPSVGASALVQSRIEYWPSGQVRLQAQVRHERFHGTYRTFYASGRPFEVRHFVDGREEGRQQSFTEQGELFLNYEVWQGRRFGFLNARPCMPVASPGA